MIPMHRWLPLAYHSFIPFRKARHCCMVLFLWHSHLALVNLILPRVLCVERPLWAWFCLWCRAQILQLVLRDWVALYSFLSVVQYLTLDTSTRCHTWSHSTLSYLVCGASSSLNKLVLATRCHLIKIKRVLFPLTMLRSLSFLIPSFTKINMLSYPEVSDAKQKKNLFFK